ncbi:hypothetical protein BCR34DRAFT_192460 [Clohesyomyces aquaticus]|uniref:Uncharacterized protein n=1 Tax=Clohesyomyces aquaticus TaxID=1231657 RepID=A0A1Y1ZY72_9PLEO|nr:hypothetical protein BCR34DRAFT_192460 [Clohesyomyces aquaticus]
MCIDPPTFFETIRNLRLLLHHSIAQIEGEVPWLLSHLPDVVGGLDEGPKMSPSAIRNITDLKKWRRGTPMPPTLEGITATSSISFFLQYPMVQTGDQKRLSSNLVATSDVKLCPVAAWTQTRKTTTPVILLTGLDEEMPRKLVQQCAYGN